MGANDYILHANAFSIQDIVNIINGEHAHFSPPHSDSNTTLSSNQAYNDITSHSLFQPCCFIAGLCGCIPLLCGSYFATPCNKIALYYDSYHGRARAFVAQQRHLVTNLLMRHLCDYDITSPDIFEAHGIVIVPVSTSDAVVFANRAGLNVAIVGDSARCGWFVTVEAGFSIARNLVVNRRAVTLSNNKVLRRNNTTYLAYNSLHLFNVKPNALCIVSQPGVHSENHYHLLSPGLYVFNSPYLTFCTVISTAVQDMIISEQQVTTADGVILQNCVAVLSYRIMEADAHKLLNLNIVKYKDVILDYARRTMLHEISLIDYQSNTTTSFSFSTDSQQHHEGSNNDVDNGDETTSLIGVSSTSHDRSTTFMESSSGTSHFRPTLEANMRSALQSSLSQFGVQIMVFALQSFSPPFSLSAAVTSSLALRSQALFDAQSQAIRNDTTLQAAMVQADVIVTRANALQQACAAVAHDKHAKQLQILDAKRSIAHEYGTGSLRTLFFGHHS